MKIIYFNDGQNGEDWLKWRRSILGGTDSSIILGVNPYENIKELRDRKLGKVPEKESNKWMTRGKELEPIALSEFILTTSINMKPLCVESSEYPFLGASLDGLSDCYRYILEIKCPGKKNMEIAKKGKILPYYYAQMQNNLLVTQAEMCYYYCYDGKEGHTIEVYPDKAWEKEYLPKAEEFWMSLIFNKE